MAKKETARPSYTKYCIVPMCKNTSKNAPDKIFFHVPHGDQIREMWCKSMKRGKVAATSALVCCADHFDLEEDTENFMEYEIMRLQEGSKVRLRLKKGIVPHKFECQRENIPTPPKRLCAERRDIQEVPEATTIITCEQAIKEIVNSEAQPSSTSSSLSLKVPERQVKADCDPQPCASSPLNVNSNETNNSHYDKAIQVNMNEKPHKADKAITVQVRAKYRSTGVNVNIVPNCRDTSTSTSLAPMTHASTSPLKTSVEINSPQISSQTSLVSSDYVPPSIQSESSWCEYELEVEEDKQFKNLMRSCTITAIEKDPKMLLGLRKESFYLSQLLSDNIAAPTLHILITLKKIKLNESFSILSQQFGYAQSTVSRIFSQTLPLLKEKMSDLIVWPTKSVIRNQCPIAFRARYLKVVSIIDCLEIEIEKTTDAVHQALTWSQYKRCNSLKYLISCTPHGLVNFVSEGYGGRATDVTIVKNCSYLDHLPPDSAVMADRGFKDISHLLKGKKCSLIRPPSVSTSTSSTKAEVKESKRIAALRIHVERVIGRLREFHLLKPHVCIDNHLISVLDEVIVVACGIINMQIVLIKKNE